MEALISSVGLSNMFYVMAAIYGVAMFLGYVLIARPQGYVYDPKKSVVKKSTILKKPVFIGIWLMFYINITCGLALISQEKDILKGVLHNLNYSEAEIIGMVSLVLAVDAAFNTIGRLGFSTLSDHLKKRETAYKIIFAMSIVVCSLAMMSGAIEKAILPIVLAMLFLVNAGYGGGFSTLPVLLDQHFGMKTISTVHGMALSAWAMAGLSGNQMAAFIVHRLGLGYETVVVVITVMYCVALGISLYVSHVKSETEEVTTEPVVDIDCPIAPAH
jgi:OFA family oxalate/formate antiporter-like MFS transporter